MKEEWLLNGAVVPVDVETTASLVAEIRRLIGVIGGMALAQQEPDRQLMQQALEALNSGVQTRASGIDWIEYDSLLAKQAITALRKALAEQPEQPAQQEPVAYLCENAVGHRYFRWKKPSGMYKPIALYTTPPPQRTWVGLTNAEVKQLCLAVGTEPIEVRLIEAKLKEKNNGFA